MCAGYLDDKCQHILRMSVGSPIVWGGGCFFVVVVLSSEVLYILT